MTVREWFEFLKNDGRIKYFAAIMSGEELPLRDDYYTIKDFAENIGSDILDSKVIDARPYNLQRGEEQFCLLVFEPTTKKMIALKNFFDTVMDYVDSTYEYDRIIEAFCKYKEAMEEE